MIATPIIFPRAFTIALPDAPWPLLPMKSTLGGPHLRMLVWQSGRDGLAGIALSISSKRGLIKEFNPILSVIDLNSSPIDFDTPFLVEYVVFSGQFCLSQSRTFVMIFANLIAFVNVALGRAIPPPWILFNCSNILPRLVSKILFIWPNISLMKFSTPQIGTSKTWPTIFSKLFPR